MLSDADWLMRAAELAVPQFTATGGARSSGQPAAAASRARGPSAAPDVGASPTAHLTAIDNDIDSLSFDFEEHTRSLKQNVMSRLYELKRKLLLHNRATLEQQQAAHEDEMQRKQDFCDAMRHEAVNAKVKAEQARGMMFRVVCGYAGLSEYIRNLRELAEGWRRWKDFTVSSKRVKALLRKATMHFDRSYMLRRNLHKWRDWARTSSKMRAEYAHEIAIAKAREHERAHTS